MEEADNQQQIYSTDPALVEWREGHVPFSTRFNDIYYPTRGALSQSYSVFLESNGLPTRWSQLSMQRSFVIGELGFGTGLNFALTLKEWRATKERPNRLYYISFEQFPLSKGEIERALRTFPVLLPEGESLLTSYPPLIRGTQRLEFPEDQVYLDLVFEEASVGLQQKKFQADAWYLDGFDPKKNDSLWNQELFSQLNDHSHSESTFGTYSSAGWVRRGLEGCGCQVEKVKNSTRKRETIRGEFAAATIKNESSPPDQVRIIGAGYAGVQLARSLTKRGIAVSLIEREGASCLKASGNPQGIILPYITRKPSIQSELYLSCYIYALENLRKLVLPKDVFDTAGIVHFPSTDRLKSLLERLPSLVLPPEIAVGMSVSEIEQLLQAPVTSPGFHYPRGSWIAPQKVGRLLLESSELISFERFSEWEHYSEDQSDVITVYATAHEAKKSPFQEDLLLEPVRGQITQVAELKETKHLSTILCFDGYLLPNREGHHLLGATYEHNSLDESIREKDNEKLINNLLQWIPQWDFNPGEKLNSRVAFRTSTRDRLPMVGQLSSPPTDTQTKNFPYFFVGFGSRGFTSIPLLAEELACQIAQEPPPLFLESFELFQHQDFGPED